MVAEGRDGAGMGFGCGDDVNGGVEGCELGEGTCDKRKVNAVRIMEGGDEGGHYLAQMGEEPKE